MWKLSLGLVFEVDEATFDKVIEGVWYTGDQLVSRLIAARRPGLPVGDGLEFPAAVRRLNVVFEKPTPAMAPTGGWYVFDEEL